MCTAYQRVGADIIHSSQPTYEPFDRSRNGRFLPCQREPHANLREATEATMLDNSAKLRNPTDRRRSFIGGTDARIIMGNDEPALLRLWHEKRGETEPEDLSGNLIVQLGLAI